MNLDQAINTLGKAIPYPGSVTCLELTPALQLGLEALTYLNRLRAYSLEHRKHRLPSETKD